MTPISRESWEMAEALRIKGQTSSPSQEVALTLDEHLPASKTPLSSWGVVVDHTGEGQVAYMGQPVYGGGGPNQADDGLLNDAQKSDGDKLVYRQDVMDMAIGVPKGKMIARTMPGVPDRFSSTLPSQNVVAADAPWIMEHHFRKPIQYYRWESVEEFTMTVEDYVNHVRFYLDNFAPLGIGLLVNIFDGGPYGVLNTHGINHVRMNSPQFITDPQVRAYLKRGIERTAGSLVDLDGLLISLFNEPHCWMWFFQPKDGKLVFDTKAFSDFVQDLVEFTKSLGVHFPLSFGMWSSDALGFMLPPGLGIVDVEPLINTTALKLCDFMEFHSYAPVEVMINDLRWGIARRNASNKKMAMVMSEMGFPGTPSDQLLTSFQQYFTAFPYLMTLWWSIQFPGEQPAYAINPRYAPNAETVAWLVNRLKTNQPQPAMAKMGMATTHIPRSLMPQYL